MRIALIRHDDASFEKQIDEVLEEIPCTWAQYPQDAAGKMGIINMEHNEFKSACTDEEKAHELIHLAAACKYLWEELTHADK